MSEHRDGMEEKMNDETDGCMVCLIISRAQS